jgi:flap endonuclease-1
VFAAGSEDMDTLCFATPVLLRHLTFSEAKKEPIAEINLAQALLELELTMDQFIDLAILMGCDYCETIRGIGPHRALQLIREHKTIEKILEKIDGKKYTVPEDWAFAMARGLIQNPDVTDPAEVEVFLLLFNRDS